MKLFTVNGVQSFEKIPGHILFGGRPKFFQFAGRLTAAPEVELIGVVNSTTQGTLPREFVQPTIAGIRDACLDQLHPPRSPGRVCSVQVEIVLAKTHDVDTTPEAIALWTRMFAECLVHGWLTTPLQPFPAGWATDAVVGLARAAAEDGAFDRLPILADALEDAGCDHALALAHLRTCAEHAPRCWVADWVLAANL